MGFHQAQKLVLNRGSLSFWKQFWEKVQNCGRGEEMKNEK